MNAAQNPSDRPVPFGVRAKRAGVLARRAVHRGASAVSRLTAEASTAPTAAAAAPAPARRLERLSPAEALKENGFTIFRNAFSAVEVAELAAAMKAEAGIVDGEKFMKVDAPNHYTSTRAVLFDDRVLYAVRSAIGAEGRVLQVSDLHYRHDTAGWHRDSVHRAKDSSQAPDWADLDGGEFGVVKAILYMEADNAAMGIIPGSHASPIEMDHDRIGRIERAGGQLVIGDSDEPNRRFSEQERSLPFAWKANPGDLLVFDERLYHAGRRVDNGKVTSERSAPKFTLSLVFGADNRHSERMYSYFRYARRELNYEPLDPTFRDQLAERGLVLSAGWGNYYEQAPQDLRHAYLKRPETMEPLIEEFSRAGAHAG